MGGELIDSRARVRELKAQGKQLLASSQQMAETSLHLRTEQQESLDTLVCAAEAESKLNVAQKQIADMLRLLDEQSKKLEILADVFIISLGSTLTCPCSATLIFNRIFTRRRSKSTRSIPKFLLRIKLYWTLASITRSKSALYYSRAEKLRIRNTRLNFGSRIEEPTATL
ncbi:hypothetical protein FIBSPDRAFT_176736 [Athelia psychrophila]|uniref:Uncharacterized protein n=1 Tax=Athelia psychrophila TaxID=1759441 RepID=A0A166SMY3_9AGAM|nr:hypothetical protein FIBSPDRAFT_176736 [Fibularhizoctonia sp. CBS 109695]